jgi:hypothetical protein
MNKVLLVAAATALAISGSVFAKGNGVRTGASANEYIDKNAQITANDCQQLSVAPARNACMRSAQNGSGTSENTGGTSGSGGMGQGSGGHSMPGGSMGSSTSGGQSMHGGSMGASGSGPRSPMQQPH